MADDDDDDSMRARPAGACRVVRWDVDWWTRITHTISSPSRTARRRFALLGPRRGQVGRPPLPAQPSPNSTLRVMTCVRDHTQARTIITGAHTRACMYHFLVTQCLLSSAKRRNRTTNRQTTVHISYHKHRVVIVVVWSPLSPTVFRVAAHHERRQYYLLYIHTDGTCDF